MEKNLHIEHLLKRYSELTGLKDEIEKTAKAIISTYKSGGKLLICGNGGSSSDADHIAGELMKSFEKKRPINQELKANLQKLSGKHGNYLAANLQQGLPAISLSAHTALTTAIINDIGADLIFAQQVTGYGIPGDILMGISTSGNSPNVVNALIVAKAKGLVTIGLTGETGGNMNDFCDILINVPERQTVNIQELHLPVYHTICRMVEDYFFVLKE